MRNILQEDLILIEDSYNHAIANNENTFEIHVMALEGESDFKESISLFLSTHKNISFTVTELDWGYRFHID